MVSLSFNNMNCSYKTVNGGIFAMEAGFAFSDENKKDTLTESADFPFLYAKEVPWKNSID